MVLHHTAIIVSDEVSAVRFYGILGFSVRERHERPEKNDVLLFLSDGTSTLELFVKPDAPARLTSPEALGLRHIAFECDDLDALCAAFAEAGFPAEDIRVDPLCGTRFTFVRDPDGLPVELRLLFLKEK